MMNFLACNSMLIRYMKAVIQSIASASSTSVFNKLFWQQSTNKAFLKFVKIKAVITHNKIIAITLVCFIE